MGRFVTSRALMGVAIACVLVPGAACNVLTGVSSLATCPDDCTSITPGAPGGDEGGVRADGGSIVFEAGSLPATCSGNETACAGNIAAQCIGGNWMKTTCAQTCAAGKCDSWPSCRNAAGMGCGVASATPTASCCDTAAVPGGTFNRRNTPVVSAATVSAFTLDKYEVTVGRMRAFVDAGGVTKTTPPMPGVGAHPKIPNSGWHSEWNVFLPSDVMALRASMVKDGDNPTWTDTASTKEHLPINNVTFFVAFAFCAWDGGRLPTYAELNYAGAGGSEQRQYPWGSSSNDVSINASRAAYDCNFKLPARSCPASYCSDNTSPPCDTTTCVAPASCVNPSCTGCSGADIAPVGSLSAGAGKWGHFDLSGNVSELVNDTEGVFTIPCVDCARLPGTSIHGAMTPNPHLEATFLALSGAWDAPPTELRTPSYGTMRDDEVDDDIGFRCVH